MDVEALMNANLLDVFAERDRERRRAAIARTYAPDVAFNDPEGAVVGHDAVDAKVQALLDGAPDFVFAPTGPVCVNHDIGHLAWGFGPEGQPPVVQGFDIAVVADGRIAKLYTMLVAP